MPTVRISRRCLLHSIDPVVVSRLAAMHPDFLLPTTYYLLHYILYYLLPTALLHYLLYYLLPTTYCLLPTTYYLLPTAYCLLPTTYYLQYCLLPTTSGMHLTLLGLPCRPPAASRPLPAPAVVPVVQGKADLCAVGAAVQPRPRRHVNRHVCRSDRDAVSLLRLLVGAGAAVPRTWRIRSFPARPSGA